MTYGWTIEEIDKVTWPMMQKLFNRIKETPSADLILHGFMKAKMPPEIGKAMGGLPIKKGKVKRRA
jgi:hypothetical protein